MKHPTFGSKVSNNFLSNNFLTKKLLTFSLKVQNHPLDYTEPSARRKPIFPSILLNFSFDFTEAPSPQRKYGEPSPLQRRALVIETPSLRQLVESKGAVQSIHRWGSENPQKWCTKSSKSDGSDRKIRRYFVLGKKNAEGMKEHRQAVKCEARNPC